MVNLSCWGRCDEPCEEGASRVRAGRAGGLAAHFPLPSPEAAARAAAAPPPPAFPGPLFTAPGAAPALASCPRHSRGSGGGGCAPEPPRPRPPPGCGGAFQGPPLVGGRVSPLPPLQSSGGGCTSSAPSASGRGTTRPRESPSPSRGSEVFLQSPLRRGISQRPKFSGGGRPYPRFPAPFQQAALFQEGCAWDLPPLPGSESSPGVRGAR